MPSQLLSLIRKYLAVPVGFLLAAIVYTWPLAIHLSDRVVEGVDTGQMIWNLWDGARRLATGTDLFHTTMLYYPAGSDLYLHTWSPVVALPLAPITLLLGPVVAYNLALLLGFTLTGITAYWLCRDLGAGPWSAAFAGAAFDFCAWHLVRLHGHTNQTSIYWIPLYLLCLFRLARPVAQSDQGRMLWPALTGLTLVLLALVDFQQVVYVALPTALWLLHRLLDRQQARRGRLVVQVGAAWGLAALLLAPILVGLVRQQAGGEYVRPDLSQVVTFSADLLAYFVPFQYNTFVGPAVTPLVNTLWGKLDTERALYLTLTLIALGGWGLWRLRRQDRYWFHLLIVAGVLSLGPALHFAGRTFFPLPYLALYLLPGGDSLRAPARFGIVVVLALAVPAALAITRWEQAWQAAPPGSPAAQRRKLALAGAFMALALETATFPNPMVALTVPTFYRQLAQEAAPQRAVVDVPLRDEGIYEYYQTIHGHPLVGGYLSRDRIDPLIEGGPLLRDLKYLDSGDIIGQDVIAAGQALAARNGIGYIVLHKNPPLTRLGYLPWTAADQARVQDLAARAGHPVYEDGEIAAYALNAPPAVRQPALVLGAGWQPVGDDAQQGRGRWAGPGAVMTLDAAQPTTVTLRLTARAYPAARSLRLVGAAGTLATWVITATATDYRSPPFAVPAGVTALRLESAGAPGYLPTLPLDRYAVAAIAYITRLDITPRP